MQGLKGKIQSFGKEEGLKRSAYQAPPQVGI